MKTKILWAVIGLSLFAITPAFAAEAHTFRAEIPFQFTASGKLMPAGNYEFSMDYDNLTVSVSNLAKGDSVFEPIITFLAPAQHSEATDSQIIFDKVGNTYTLSELWEPDMQGILVHVTKGKHEHQVVHVKR